MIFDGKKCEQLYQEYCNGRVEALTELLEESDGLVNVFACKYGYGDNAHLYDDLRQTGLVKVYDTVRNKRYNPKHGTPLHTFLSGVLDRKMIDVMRSEGRRGSYASVDDFEEILTDTGFQPMLSGIYRNGDSAEEFEKFTQRTAAYAVKRFPSLHREVAREASEYVCDALSQASKPTAVVTTLRVLYDIKRNTQVFIRSVRAHYAAQLVHQTIYETEALAVVDDRTEWMLAPEICLIVGPDVYSKLQYFMRKTSVRF